MSTIQFQHAAEVWQQFPTLAAAVLRCDGVRQDGAVSTRERLQPFYDLAAARLEDGPEAEFPEIQAWRRTFSAMGLKPTQYRCASEALLRRFRKERSLPPIAPIIDLCNAISLAYAIPIAVFDVARIDGGITVRPADGTETYLTFSGETENPESGEIVFADGAGNAHARRWTNRQSALSAVRPATTSVLLVAEALHGAAAADVARLADTVGDEFLAVWDAKAQRAQLTADQPLFVSQ